MVTLYNHHNSLFYSYLCAHSSSTDGLHSGGKADLDNACNNAATCSSRQLS